MNIQIDWEGTDITHYVTEYTRQQDICTGVGNLDIIVSGTISASFQTWDKITVYEDSTKVGEYNICSYEKQAPGGAYVIACQDDSKRLQDYFISSQIQPTAPSLSRYWIELILGMAGVSYSINTTSQGEAVSVETAFGMQAAYDAIMTLLQLSGWYMYFDESGECQIGELELAVSPIETFGDDVILQTSYRKDDKMMRNRVVVWGASDPESGWVWAEVQSPTEWDRDDGEDYRTVVYANSAIQSSANALIIANKILNEFSQTTPIKEIVVAGFYPNVVLGSIISSTSKYNQFSGMVTTLIVNVKSDGAVTTLTIDEKCPRLFGYAYEGDGWIYIGTREHGVWRKQFTGTTWSDYSDGITDLNIKDLAVYSDLLACVTATTGDLYIRRTSDTSWTKYISPSGFIDFSDPNNPITVASGILATACAIDRSYGIGGCVNATFTLPGSGTATISGLFPPSGNRSWINGITAETTDIFSHQIHLTSEDMVVGSGVLIPSREFYDVATIDLETNDVGENIISTQVVKSITVSGGCNTDFNMADASWHSGGGIFDGDTYFGVLNLGICGKPNITTLPTPPEGSLLFSDVPGGTTSLWCGDVREGGTIVSAFERANDSYISLYDFQSSSTLTSLDVRKKLLDNNYSFTTYDFTGKGLEGKVPVKIVRLNPTNFRVLMYYQDDTLISAFYPVFHFYLYHLDISDLEVIEWVDYGVPKTLSDQYMFTGSNPLGFIGFASLHRNVMSCYGDKYINIINRYRDSTATYNGELLIQTINVETGAIYEARVVSNTPSSMFYTLGCDETPNYAISAFIEEIAGTGISPATGTLPSLRVYVVIVDKYFGTTIVKRHDVDFDQQYGENRYTHTIYHPLYDTAGGYAGGREQAFVRGWKEDIDTGNGIAKIYFPYCVICYAGTEQYIYYMSYLLTVDLKSADITHETYYTISYDGSLITNQTPTWLREPNAESPPYVTAHIIQATYSRNLSKSPVIFGGIRTSPDGPGLAISALADPDNPDSYKVPDFRTTGMNYPYQVSPLIDDIDDSIYMVLYSGGLATPPATPGYIKYIGMTQEGIPTKLGTRYSISSTPSWITVLDNFICNSSYIGATTTTTFKNWPGSSYIDSAQSTYKVLEHLSTVPSGQFTTIFNWNRDVYLDTGKGSPTVVYERPFSGTLNGFDGVSPSNLLAASYQNELNTFESITPQQNVYDARLFDIADFTNFPYSGTFPESLLDRFIGVATGDEDLVFIDSEFTASGFLPITEFPSGIVTHLDFTNYVLDPYIFCSVDTVASGQQFFQRDTEELTFTSRSVSLPDSPITIIRVDDDV